jgi:glutamine amidotransferase
MNIGIVDYQASNLGSLTSALRELQIKNFVSSNPADFAKADLILLPGVGSFYSGVKNLFESGLDESIKKHANLGKPVLGICLGMHLLGSIGYEGGTANGLGLIPGEILKLEPIDGFRIPHMGWDEIQSNGNKNFVYFAHSYFFSPRAGSEIKVMSTFQSGGKSLPAHIQSKNFSGIQYHPEKSGSVGLQILQETLKNLVSSV